MLGQVGRRGHTSTLRVDPGVDVVGDIAARNPANRTHRETKLFTALQHLRGEGGEESELAPLQTYVNKDKNMATHPELKAANGQTRH